MNIKDVWTALVDWKTVVRYGADPIEAISGHLCGPNCLHWTSLSEERRRVLLKAPWNQKARA
jgi:hypothetical protein